MKTLKAVLATVFVATLIKLVASELIPLRFEWQYDNIAPEVFKLYDAATVTGPYVVIATIPGVSNGVTVTNHAIVADNSFNHFWFLTASNIMGESLPSNTVTGASPFQVHLFTVKRNKTN